MSRSYYRGGLLGVLVVSVFASCLSCRPDSQKYHARPVTLYHSYQDGSDIWTGRIVIVELHANTYQVSSKGLEWYSRSERNPCDLLFTPDAETPLPSNPSRTVIVEGVCVGRKDHSPFGPSFYVLVKDCTIKSQ